MVICLTVILLFLMCYSSTAIAYEGRRERSVLLNGVWEFALGQGDERAETPEGQAALEWRQVILPGQFLEPDPGAHRELFRAILLLTPASARQVPLLLHSSPSVQGSVSRGG